MAWAAVIGAGATLAGSLIGGKKGATDQTQSNKKSMDPRIDSRYFGEGGILSDLDKWYGENKSGINPDMQAGLDQMRNVYKSPLATQGYERMAQSGYDLMGRGVAENPFTTGRMPNFGNLQNGAYQQPTQTAQQPAQPEQQAAQGGLLTSPLPSLNNGFAASPVAAPAAPAAPAQPSMTQDDFQRLYAEEMKRQQRDWYNTPSNNPNVI